MKTDTWEIMSIRLHKEQKAKLEKKAQDRGTHMADIIRSLIDKMK